MKYFPYIIHPYKDSFGVWFIERGYEHKEPLGTFISRAQAESFISQKQNPSR